MFHIKILALVFLSSCFASATVATTQLSLAQKRSRMLLEYNVGRQDERIITRLFEDGTVVRYQQGDSLEQRTPLPRLKFSAGLMEEITSTIQEALISGRLMRTAQCLPLVAQQTEGKESAPLNWSRLEIQDENHERWILDDQLFNQSFCQNLVNLEKKEKLKELIETSFLKD